MSLLNCHIAFRLMPLVVLSSVAACNSNSGESKQTKQQADLFASFEGCVINGGAVAESYPAQCKLDGESYVEDITRGKQGDTRRLLFEIGPIKSSCQAFHSIVQQCLSVNGRNFYEVISGFSHENGVRSVIEVERTQICDPEVIQSCPMDIGIYEYKLLKVLSSTAESRNP